MKRVDDAFAAYRKALDREPFKAEWRFEYAILLEEEDRIPEAIKEFKRVAQEDAKLKDKAEEHINDLEF